MKQISPELDAEIDKILQEIGSRLKEKRKGIEPNYISFAEKYNFSRASVLRVEQGYNTFREQMLIFGDTLSINLEDLFQGL